MPAGRQKSVVVPELRNLRAKPTFTVYRLASSKSYTIYCAALAIRILYRSVNPGEDSQIVEFFNPAVSSTGERGSPALMVIVFSIRLWRVVWLPEVITSRTYCLLPSVTW